MLEVASASIGSTINFNEDNKPESKFYETLFLGAIAGFGVMVGFSNGISLAKKKDEKAFNKGLMMLNERPNMPQMETGARLAVRALGWGSLWAFAGVGLVSGSIWCLSGAKDLKDFRQKMGQLLPSVPRNNPPQGRTEFESFRDLFNYLAEESDTSKQKLKNPENTVQEVD
ncbi:hypothetical protein RDWZM_004244 [Blomia tropicalis]|uniref:Transmembrane protein 242 n=1 Tax=Blomia tropicalis TaxID=40697 RepID=A0A9Q0RTB7_BLOTA|nr:hypothetical protein RDWZM_004244 [Blomia tropicalis]